MLDEAIDRAQRRYHKLVVLIGPAGSGKTAMLRSGVVKEYHYINLNLELGRRLIDTPVEDRPSCVQTCIENILMSLTADVILLDNTELIFTPQLQIDPLRLFHAMSRNKTIVVTWNGTYDGNTLTYAEPYHPEYRSYTTQEVDAEIIPLGSW